MSQIYQPPKILIRYNTLNNYIFKTEEAYKYFYLQLAEETSHLAPHGVPSNPISKALSSTRLNELQNVDEQQYYQQSADGNLNVPNSANPFQTY